MTIYGYCRISKVTQKIHRQIDNIKKVNESAVIIEEAYTGTKIIGRDKWNKLYKQVKKGDTIIFDSVSRMSRNASEGIEQYMDLFDRGITLEFIKEPHINTETYRKQIERANILNTDNKIVNAILEGVTKALKELAKEQIKLAFEQAEKEVIDLRQRTKEGIAMAKALNPDTRIGTEPGRKLVTKKSIEAKDNIRKYSKDFDGTLNDKDAIVLCKISRNSYYKYKKELIEELNNRECL